MDEFFESVIDPIAILKQADGLTTIIADTFSTHFVAG